MTDKHSAIEPSFADAILAISAATDLSEETRRHWRSSLTGIARAFDQPLELIPARYSAIRARMAALHHVPLDWVAKTLANHKSNAKAALIWFAKEKDVLPHGVALSPAWDRLRIRLTNPSTRYRLMPLMRFCSGVQIEPEAVDEAVIDRYMDHRTRTTARASDAASRRILARLWNAGIGNIDGWPQQRLVEPSVKAAEGPGWEDFPEGLRADIEGYLAGLNRIRQNRTGQRIRPCKPSTITTRRRELVAAVRMAVQVGVPLGSLTSLAALIHPDVAEKVFEGYWPKEEEAPSTYTINLSCRFVALAHSVGGLDEAALRKLGDLRFTLEQHREDGMTPKNLALIRCVLTDAVWSRVTNLPDQLMRQARLERRHAPVRAAVLAQIAVAVAILTVAPIRLGNLAGIRLGENLIKPGGPQSNYFLAFNKYDVKNRVPLQFKLDETVTTIINEYVHDFRPALTRGSNADWLFPGESGGHKEKISFSTQIVNRVEKSTGLRITVHQFRHAAGALILKHRPGQYELVRRLLGHASVQTTIKFYLELETTQASEIFTDIVRNRLEFRPDAS
ncbi:MAG: tyrosine-type recombinase/integrase [Bradyrhizobium sp.]|uniref:tyrosine-type recombinase/integrase n=1 Tax=Bradyrhizobium sp. TaxID=376 RepID=UPI002722634B|nr:tyrosine-type recombinase/integrase [Bradyrhizobium sp.]MDO8400765.1 tyrosine-type recombinase/integrase [Bradyrhizobium sp.]